MIIKPEAKERVVEIFRRDGQLLRAAACDSSVAGQRPVARAARAPRESGRALSQISPSGFSQLRLLAWRFAQGGQAECPLS